jgi:hypothetical protein
MDAITDSTVAFFFGFCGGFFIFEPRDGITSI